MNQSYNNNIINVNSVFLCSYLKLGFYSECQRQKLELSIVVGFNSKLLKLRFSDLLRYVDSWSESEESDEGIILKTR